MFFDNLSYFKEKGLLREIRDRTSPQGPRVKFNGKKFINFASNDYLGLSNHSYVIRKAEEALYNYGYGSAASRLLGGGSTIHRQLENKIAQFKGAEKALIFNSGYSANTGIIPSITNEEDAIFSDELNHASIIDGCRISKAKVFVYKHKDVLYLEKLMRKESAKTKLVVTDSVFSMDGDIAPLHDLFHLCKKNNALLYIDDAHATGVLGNGKGALSHFHIKPQPWIIQMGTFSKAIGSFGAFVTGTAEAIDWILNTARSFIYSTALPVCVISASLAALEVIQNNPDLIRSLWDKTNKFANEIKKLGLIKTRIETPIIPIKTETIGEASMLSEYLFQNGIFAPSIKPPTVKEPRIRITITAAHAEEDIERLIEVLRERIK